MDRASFCRELETLGFVYDTPLRAWVRPTGPFSGISDDMIDDLTGDTIIDRLQRETLAMFREGAHEVNLSVTHETHPGPGTTRTYKLGLFGSQRLA